MRFLFVGGKIMIQEMIQQDTFDQEQTPAMLQLETGTASHTAFVLLWQLIITTICNLQY